MYIDKQNIMSAAQAITATAASTDVIDLGLGDIGKSQDQAPYLYVKVGAAFNTLTSLNIKLQTSVDEAFSSPIDTDIAKEVVLASLTINSEQIRARLPIGCKRYIRMYYTVTGSNPSTGTISAYLLEDLQASF